MKILVNNGSLGRMGKTTIAYTLYKQFKAQGKKCGYVTNDLINASIPLRKHIENGELYFVPPGDEVIFPEGDVIYDFGGMPDSRLINIAKEVDVILVPVHYQSKDEIRLTIENINAFKKHNKNIILIINNCDNADAKLAKFVFSSSFPGITILNISHSKFIRRLANDNQTVFEVAAASKGDAKQLAKKIIPQMNKLLEVLNIGGPYV